MKKTNKSTERTSYQGITITATLDSLIEVIGEPNHIDEESETINFVWDCETDEGEVFTIYNFMSDELDREIVFRIGSFSQSISSKAKEEVLSKLNQ
jgi:hypothetical protein